jgi:hypothetical protein
MGVMELLNTFKGKHQRFPFGIWVCLSVIGMIGVFFYFTPWGMRYLLTGHFFPINRIDNLVNSQTVSGWQEDGLKLSDGRVIMPLGMKKLPKSSESLSIVLKNGVEVASDGKVYGLIKIHHWCGNDPVENDLRKIDIGQLLAFYHEGTSTIKPYQYADDGFVKSGGGSKYGWSISSLVEMRMMFDPKFADLFTPEKS